MQEASEEIQSLISLVENAKRKLEISKELRNICEESKRTNTRIFVTPQEASLIIDCQLSFSPSKQHKKIKVRGRTVYDLVTLLDPDGACNADL